MDLTIKVVNKNMMIGTYPIENINEKVKIIFKKHQVEIIELKSKVTKTFMDKISDFCRQSDKHYLN